MKGTLFTRRGSNYVKSCIENDCKRSSKLKLKGKHEINKGTEAP